MSLIADALRKADNVAPSPSSAPPPPRSPWLAGALLATCLLFIAALLWQRAPAPSPLTLGPARPEGSKAPSNLGFSKTSGLNLLRLAEGQWRLSGIVQGGDGGSLALINNRVIEEGDTVDGARITRIAQDEVELEAQGQTKTIRLQ